MRKIGIVGTEISEDALIDRAVKMGFELWSVNNLYNRWEGIPFSRWYELHTIEHKGQKYYRRAFEYYPINSDQTVKEYLESLDQLEIPVFMQKKWKIIRRSEQFPFNAIRRLWGDYFGCSFTWMVAQAILEDVDEIGFFGLAFGTTEYYYQRPSLERMIGFAEGRGIKITIDPTSQLLCGDFIYAIGENFDLTYLLYGEFTREMAMMFVSGLSERLAYAVQNPEGRRR